MDATVTETTAYQKIGTFDANMCVICKDGRANVVSRNGELLLDKWYDEIIRISRNHFILRGIKGYSYYNLTKKKIAPITFDENGIYSEDGKMLLYPFVKDGVVTVRAGVRHLSYSISHDPDIQFKPQFFNLRKLIFKEGVDRIYNGWSGLYDATLNGDNRIDISLPLSVVAIENDAFNNMIPFIEHIYIPRRKSYAIRLMLVEQLRGYVKVDRIFINSMKDLVTNPTGHFYTFWIPSRPFSWQVFAQYSFYFIFFICLLYNGVKAYLHTFLPFHIEMYFGIPLYLILYIIDSLVGRMKLYSCIKRKIQSGVELVVNWMLFLVVLSMIFVPITFLVNDSFCSSQQQCQAAEISIRNINYKLSKRSFTKEIKILEVKISGSENVAWVELVDNHTFDNVSTCKVYYHRGCFGWNLLDGIGL